MTDILPLIALHGAGMGPGVFADLALRRLPLLAVPAPAGGDIAEMAANLALSAPCVLMGHSMGALVALEAAGNPLVKGLVLLGAAAAMPVHPDLMKKAREAPEAAMELVAKWSVGKGRDDVKTRLASFMVPATLAAGLAACDAYAFRQGTDKPVLVLSGAEDKMVRAEEGEKLARSLPRGRFHAVPGAGHMMMMEEPDATAAIISEFLREISESCP